MRSDVENLARWLLSRQPSRSMSAAHLRERLVAELGVQVAGAPQLVRDLTGASGIVVLDAPVPVLQADDSADWHDAYATALRLAFADAEIRLVLTDADAVDTPGDSASDGNALRRVARSVLDLAAEAGDDPALRQELNIALAEAESYARQLACDVPTAAVTPQPSGVAEADRSTIPPRDPPPRAKSPRRPPRRSSPQPRPGESR